MEVSLSGSSSVVNIVVNIVVPIIINIVIKIAARDDERVALRQQFCTI
jgi:hypothetical protein